MFIYLDVRFEAGDSILKHQNGMAVVVDNCCQFQNESFSSTQKVKKFRLLFISHKSKIEILTSS